MITVTFFSGSRGVCSGMILVFDLFWRRPDQREYVIMVLAYVRWRAVVMVPPLMGSSITLPPFSVMKRCAAFSLIPVSAPGPHNFGFYSSCSNNSVICVEHARFWLASGHSWRQKLACQCRVYERYAIYISPPPLRRWWTRPELGRRHFRLFVRKVECYLSSYPWILCFCTSFNIVSGVVNAVTCQEQEEQRVKGDRRREVQNVSILDGEIALGVCR